jgi:drug/metabolite transporter (DMT)-like permease
MTSQWRIAAAFGAIYLIWGSTYLSIAVAVEDVPPVFMVAVRGLLAGGVLYFRARRRGAAPFQIREMVTMVPTASLLFGGGYVLVGWAEQQVPSGAAALLNSTTPAWVVLFEWLSRRRARPDFRFLIALALGMIGVALLVGGNGGGTLPIVPALAVVVASVAWAAGTLQTRLHANGDPGRKAALQLVTGGLLLLPVSALSGELPDVIAGFSTRSIGALAYLVIAGSLVGYSAYVWLLHQVSASKVASHAYVNPLIAVALGAGLAGERLYPTTLLAALLILVSVFYVVKEKPAVMQPRPSVFPVRPPRIAA